MSLRTGNIGLAVALGLMLVGLAFVGMDPSDTEMHLIVWPASLIGMGVTLTLIGREEYRDRARRREAERRYSSSYSDSRASSAPRRP
jgi:hypothetical protein